MAYSRSSKSVLVTNVPVYVDVGTVTDKLNIHFQKRVFGGEAEVENVRLIDNPNGDPKQPLYLVTFDSTRGVNAAIRKNDDRVHRVNFGMKHKVQLRVTACPLELESKYLEKASKLSKSNRQGKESSIKMMASLPADKQQEMMSQNVSTSMSTKHPSFDPRTETHPEPERELSAEIPIASDDEACCSQINMATATPTQYPEKLLNEIDEQLLLCPICYVRFKSPKILPCFHTFCEHCLDEWVRTNGGKLVCPTCKEDTPLTARGVGGIRENRFIADLLKLVSDIYDTTTVSKCENCKKAATIWCNDCAQFFCDDCKTIHSSVRLLQNHELLAIEEYNRRVEAQHGSVIMPRFCEIHKNDKLEFFCDTCEATVCLRCTVVEHSPREHDIISMNKAMEKYLPTMKEHVTSLAQKTIDLKKEKKWMSNVVDTLELNKTQAEREINDTVSKLQAMIKKEQSKILGKVSDVYHPKRKQADAVMESIEFSLGSTESIHSYMTHLLKYGGAVDVMSAKKELHHRVHAIQGKPTCDTYMDSTILFKPSIEDITLGTIHDAGGIHSTHASSQNASSNIRPSDWTQCSYRRRNKNKRSGRQQSSWYESVTN